MRKKKKASKAVRTPKKPVTINIILDGKTILRQAQAFATGFQKRNGQLADS